MHEAPRLQRPAQAPRRLPRRRPQLRIATFTPDHHTTSTTAQEHAQQDHTHRQSHEEVPPYSATCHTRRPRGRQIWTPTT
eukprot:5834691-Pyramimonas_sp.AAC.1